MRYLLLILFFCTTFFPFCKAQDSSYIKTPKHYNVVKFNPTPMLFWSERNITFSYEHIQGLHPNQSINLTVGYLELPSLLDGNIFNILTVRNTQKYGINVGIDYRFYLSKQNAHPAPSGVYLSPFLSYYASHFSSDIQSIKVPEKGTFEGGVQVWNLGAGLGYQFVIAKRFTIDFMLLGPAFSHYSFQRTLDIQMENTDIGIVNEQISTAIDRYFPILGTLLNGNKFSKSEQGSTFGLGFRYNVQFGFLF